ncbi:class I SAM-dependent methyltransferase [Candidatus Woesearchaeota archaeon]|nr:class I SAM-dependent methyltransferase [Candidatus Woesearchaeota archaeon]
MTTFLYKRNLGKRKGYIDGVFGSGRVMEWIRILMNNNFRVIKKTIKENCNDEGNVLDIGCGTGYFSRLFNNANYVGIDNSDKYIKFANTKYGGKFFVMDANKMDFKKENFDVVLMISFLHHLSDRELKGIFNDVKRVLKKNGKLIIIDPVPVNEQSNFIRRFIFSHDRGCCGRSKEQISRLLENYFKIEKYEVRNSLSCTLQLFICGI